MDVGVEVLVTSFSLYSLRKRFKAEALDLIRSRSSQDYISSIVFCAPECF